MEVDTVHDHDVMFVVATTRGGRAARDRGCVATCVQLSMNVTCPLRDALCSADVDATLTGVTRTRSGDSRFYPGVGHCSCVILWRTQQLPGVQLRPRLEQKCRFVVLAWKRERQDRCRASTPCPSHCSLGLLAFSPRSQEHAK